MSEFRDLLAHDSVNVFLDLEHFGEIHTVGGIPIRCVVDDDIHGKADAARERGVTQGTFTLFTLAHEVPRQLEGTQIEYDGCIYTVDSWRTDEGMHEITLRKLAGY